MTDTAIPISVDTILLKAVGDIARAALIQHENCQSLNLLGNIEWGHRERIRAIQGHLDKIDDLCSDLIWGIGTDEAVKVAESIWGVSEA